MKIFFYHLVTSFFTAKNLSENKNFFDFLRIFNIRFFYAFPFIRKKFNKRNILCSDENTNQFFKENNETKSSIVKDLTTKGFNDKLQLNQLIFNEVYNDISSKNSTIFFKSKLTNNEKSIFLNNGSNLKEIIKISNKLNLSHLSLDIDINKTHFIKDIALSSLFLNIARDYIGKKQISVSGQCYISNPISASKKEKQDNAQYFHYDNDFKKFLKIFIYLSDVDFESGPHSFVQYSHNKKKFKHLISKRLSDSEIINSYGKENIKEFDLPKGSVIFEDTFGLHKGTFPTKKTRALLILIYGFGEGTGVFKYSIKN